ncbi:MAG: AAA family ATPase [Oscillospiraceae bacterium]|jgi:predicted ATPase|nr:AAA family ATPase [Oscillospiraceae bacterium]
MANAITRVVIKDFLVFRGEFAADFCPGVNVLIGGNGSGKTTLMKVLYAVCCEKTEFDSIEKMNTHMLPYFGAEQITDDPTVAFSFSDGSATTIHEKIPNAVFIPTDDMLSHAKGFLALNNERKIAFDQTFVDVLSKAELGETRRITPNAASVLDNIKGIIGGEVIYENDTFYIIKEKLGKLPFSLEASGFRKLGLLWKLLRNGLLESGSILFWDEPEASINPELIPVLVKILLELQTGGVQIFVATHSYDVARWFELNKMTDNALRYFNLRKLDDGIVADVADEYTELENSVLRDADDKLFKAVVSNSMGMTE